MTGPRTWEMWAGRNPHRKGELLHAGPHSRYVQSYGLAPIPVIVTEDPDGPHWGWIHAASEALQRDAADHPSLIQPRESMFVMQFPYGPDEEAARGKGQIVRLRIEEAS